MTEFRESTKLTEDQFDEIYGGTANESPLHLTEEQLAAAQHPPYLNPGRARVKKRG